MSVVVALMVVSGHSGRCGVCGAGASVIQSGCGGQIKP